MQDDALDLYQDLVMQRARQPRHAGAPPRYDAEAEGDNPMCGDRVRLYLRHGNDGAIAELGHETRGCAICIASADLLADAVTGRDPARAMALGDEVEAMVASGTPPDDAEFGDLRALAGVHPYRSRHRCATLPWQALRAALAKAGELSPRELSDD